MGVDTAEMVDLDVTVGADGAPGEVDVQAETLPNGEASDFDPEVGFDVKAWERAQQRAEQILKPAPRPMPPVSLPSTTLCMVVRATIYQGLARLRGEVLDEAADRRIGLLERIGTMARLPYGVTLLSCACGRRWVSGEAMERHECPEAARLSEPDPTPQAKKGGAKKHE